jgi:hypothetical protein
MMKYKEFLQSVKKNTPQVCFDYVYRKISYPLSYFLYVSGVSANQIAISQTILYGVGAGFIFTGKVLPGIVFFMFAYLLDFCDGNVARVIIKTKGIPVAQMRRGLMLENFNTNFSSLAMFISLSWFFTELRSDNIFLIIAFLAFGSKMLMRYSNRHLGDILKSENVGSENEAKAIFAPAYSGNKFLCHIKFLISKSIFSGNFYFNIYFLTFLFFAEYSVIIFQIYLVTEILFNTIRLFDIFFRKVKA